jgi:hypothetical protein
MNITLTFSKHSDISCVQLMNHGKVILHWNYYLSLTYIYYLMSNGNNVLYWYKLF